jgi:hypothetical protein
VSLHTLFETQVKIGISDADFQKGIAAAGTAVKDFAVMGTQAIANFTQSLVSGVSELAQYGDHIDKQSQKMNMSAQAYQEWDAIMQHSGTTIDSMQMGMKTLANAVESDSEAFELLGMSMDDVRSMSSEELFSKTITALQNVENDTQRTYIASKLLGKGATELGALLNTSAEDTEKMRQRVHELGGVMSDESVKASAKFQDSLQDMKTSIGGLTRGIKAEFLPSFTDVMDGLTKIFAGEEGGEALLNKGIANTMTTLSKSVDKIKPVVLKLGQTAFKVIEDNVPRIAMRGARLLGKIAVEVIQDLPDILSNAGDVLYNVGSEIGGQLLSILPDSIGKNVKSIFGSIKDFIGNIDFDKLKETLGNLKDSLTPLVETIGDGVAWAFENVLKPLGEWVMNDALPVAIDVLSSAFENIKNVLDILAPVGKAVWEEFLSPLFSVIGDLATGSLTMLANGLKSLAETFKGFDTVGFIDDIINGKFGENWKLGINDIATSLELFGKDVDDFFKGPGEIWNRFWQNMGGIVYDASVKVADAISKIIEKVEKLGEMILKYPSFMEGFGEYLFDKIHGLDDIPAYGDGGRVTRPTLAIVGEKEPETIVPDSKLSTLGGVTININVEGGISSDYDVERIATKLADLNIFQTRAIGGTGF